MDTRQENCFEGWYIHSADIVPFDPIEGFGDEHRRRVDAVVNGELVIDICGKELISTSFGIRLENSGYGDVTVAKDGMEEWGTVHEGTDIDDEASVVRQLQRQATRYLGYVVGSR